MNEETREWLYDQIDCHACDDMNEAAEKAVEIGYKIGSNSGYKKGYEDGKKAGLQWQKMESLDKSIDKTLHKHQILLFNKNWELGCLQVGTLWEGKLMLIGGKFYYDFEENPTHWMPLPQAPEVSGED